MELLLFLSFVPALISAVTFYKHEQLLGPNESFPGLLDVEKCFHIDRLSGSVSSVDSGGGCVVLYANAECEGDSVPIYPGSGGAKKLSEVGFDNKTRSARRCPRTASPVVSCKSGGFIQRIAAAGAQMEVTCYDPVSQSRDTQTITGQVIGETSTKGALIGTPFACPTNGTCDLSPNTFHKNCPAGTHAFLISFRTIWETFTYNVKNFEGSCCTLLAVPKYSDTFSIAASLVPVVTCDATKATTSNCRFTRKIGFAPEESAGKSEQFNWFDEVEFKSDFRNISQNIANKFRLNATLIRDTGYNWTSTPDTIWASETVGKVEFLDVVSGTLSVIVQLVGTCGFFRVRTDQFTRLDYNKFGIEVNSTKHLRPIEYPEITSTSTELPEMILSTELPEMIMSTELPEMILSTETPVTTSSLSSTDLPVFLTTKKLVSSTTEFPAILSTTMAILPPPACSEDQGNPTESVAVWMTITGISVGLLLLGAIYHLMLHFKTRALWVRIFGKGAVNGDKTCANGHIDMVHLVQL